MHSRRQSRSAQQGGTEGNAQIAGHEGKVDDLRGYPDRPQRLAAVPDRVAPLVPGVQEGLRLALYQALAREEGGEVDEGVAAASQGAFRCAV